MNCAGAEVVGDTAQTVQVDEVGWTAGGPDRHCSGHIKVALDLQAHFKEPAQTHRREGSARMPVASLHCVCGSHYLPPASTPRIRAQPN